MTKNNNLTKGKKSSKEKKQKKIALANIQTLILLLLFLIFSGNHLLPRDKIARTQLGIRNWPLFPKKHLQMAEVYFNTGDEEQAVEEFKKAETLYRSLAFLDILGNTKKQLEEAEKLLSHPKKVRQDINYWETVLKTKPHSRDVFLRLSILNYQLYQHKKAREYWEKAFYLDPNNEVVQEFGQILGVISKQ